jgi:hypothetical protein
MSKSAIVVITLLVVFGGGQSVFAEETISEPRCVCGPSTGADVLGTGRPIFSELANAATTAEDGLPLAGLTALTALVALREDSRIDLGRIGDVRSVPDAERLSYFARERLP